MSKLKKIIEIAEQANSEEIEVWTNTFKAMGTVLKDENRIAKGIVSLKNAIVSPLFIENECTDTSYEWLNIFEDQVIAFTIVK
ncbi:MAG TPA: hypothetical protein P5556_10485 [Candidatus Gastranaerophilales bacterium]|nr:hypothetical protein [Candidatus Gastranaerophilales bacterium]